MTRTPKTLGEKLARVDDAPAAAEHDGLGAWIGYVLGNCAIVTALTVLPLVWMYLQPTHRIFEGVMLVLLGAWAVLAWIAPRVRKHDPPRISAAHFLLADDQGTILADLRLDQKTVLFDGSNIYHFGVANGLGAGPVALTAKQLRAEGYRVVSFFDANIFYTLIENGDYPKGQCHDIARLQTIFGLTQHETFVVPSGVQADKYILSTLSHLSASFVVTNDQFRDYAKIYGAVMKGNQWRKGIAIAQNEIKLKGHRFKTPVRLTQPT